MANKKQRNVYDTRKVYPIVSFPNIASDIASDPKQFQCLCAKANTKKHFFPPQLIDTKCFWKLCGQVYTSQAFVSSSR